MRRSPKLRLCPWDALVIVPVILLAVICGFTFWGQKAGPEELTVVISIDGEEVERCALTKLPDAEQAYSNNGYTLQVGLSYPLFPDGPCVRVSESNCPTQDCVHTGEISRAGQSIVCLPARIVIQLEGGADSGAGPDIVIG